ncbi:MAG: threonine ammonia-lyase, biosynthetic [Lentisphaeria bacterium]|nr:threonine ammonia-lyase, biosynthetic [Lentisphaeria bacterium]
MFETYIRKILTAQIYDLADETPVTYAHNLSNRYQNDIWIKREDLQPIFSFKIRGAHNKIRQLSKEERSRGVVCASAGNHAQGVAMSAASQEIPAIIVMPVTTPDIKVDSVRQRGAEVVLHGEAFQEAYDYALKLQQEKGLTFIHPYNDPDVIAGQGTIAREIFQQITGHIDYLFIPVGGGGILSGISVYSKYVSPSTKIIAVESDESACLQQALKAGERIILDEVGIFADGVAVPQIGELPFEIAQKCVDDSITVSTDEICAAIKDIFEDTRYLAEPSGAIAIAGVKKYIRENKLEGQLCVAVNSGANTSFGRLRHISERTELGANKEGLFAVQIPEVKGSFYEFCKNLPQTNITEFNYRYNREDAAMVFVGLELKEGTSQRHKILEHLEAQSYRVADLTDDELAKLHIRYMVGGHSHGLSERLFRVQFPEKPGALLKFLNALGSQWSISLFHYRNHASAYGRVLLGVQAAKDDEELIRRLDETGYYYKEESDNLAYELFLS